MSEVPPENGKPPEAEVAEPSLLDNVVYFVVWIIGNIASRLYLRLSVRGRENIPASGPLMIVCNHASYMDPPLVGFIMRRRVYFLAKSDLFRNPAFGWFITALGAFGIRRGASDRVALRLCGAMLRSGKALLIFPEGTRTRTGKMLDPQGGAAMILAQAPETTILPVRLEGTFEAWGPARRFPKPRKVVAHVGKPFTISEIKDPPKVKKQLYHAISTEIIHRICSA